MLLIEWHAWWGVLPALEVREYLAAYRVSLISDAGWKMDNREQVVDEWHRIAQGANVLRVKEHVKALARGDVRGEIVALFGWMRGRMGRGVQEERE